MKIPLRISKTNKKKWEAYLRARYKRPKTELPALLHLLMADQLQAYETGRTTTYFKTANLEEVRPRVIIGKRFEV